MDGKRRFSTGNKTVDAVGRMHFSGNIVPSAWYETIVKDTAGCDSIALLILADIVYWYRPTEVRDEQTGEVIGMSKKFRADILQRNYKQLERSVGVTRSQAKSALQRLEDLGLVERVFRTVDAGGVTLSNVMFIKLNAERLREVTFSRRGGCEGIRPGVWRNHAIPLVGSAARGTARFLHTYTETWIRKNTRRLPTTYPKSPPETSSCLAGDARAQALGEEQTRGTVGMGAEEGGVRARRRVPPPELLPLRVDAGGQRGAQVHRDAVDVAAAGQPEDPGYSFDDALENLKAIEEKRRAEAERRRREEQEERDRVEREEAAAAFREQDPEAKSLYEKAFRSEKHTPLQERIDSMNAYFEYMGDHFGHV